jgi:hypothetical protein
VAPGWWVGGYPGAGRDYNRSVIPTPLSSYETPRTEAPGASPGGVVHHHIAPLMRHYTLGPPVFQDPYARKRSYVI